MYMENNRLDSWAHVFRANEISETISRGLAMLARRQYVEQGCLITVVIVIQIYVFVMSVAGNPLH